MMRAALVAMVLLAAGCARSIAQEPTQGINLQSWTTIARGRYLATVGDCTACHTAPGGKPFAGGRAIETPFGSVLAANITPDRETGIGAWSNEEFLGAMHQGFTDQRLYPAMPYVYYTKTTTQDALDIRAYLNTVEPVRNDVVSNQLPFPFNIRLGMAAWNALYFDAGRWKDQLGRSAEWNRGGYLVEGLGHCGACHTSKTFLGGDDSDRHLRGNALQGWYAPDITGDARTGLGKWSVADIVEYLKTGVNRLHTASGPMAEEISDSTQHWTDDDLKAAATYLKSLPGGNNPAPARIASNDPAMRAGEAIYVDRCAACHGVKGDGISRLFPTLDGNAAVLADKPTSLLRVVLDGTRAVSTTAAPTSPAMPAFGWQLNDEQVASVVTYVRNAWGNAASAVTADDARSARSSLMARND